MMTDPQQVKALFAEAVELPREERDRFINERCGGDTTLRERVRRLVESHTEAGSFLAEPEFTSEADAAVDPDITTDTNGERWIGEFRIVKELGQGGFGTVFLADQLKPFERQVALKVIKLGMDTEQVLARFEMEKQTMAMMKHPNIAAIYEAGVTATGRPFFVMEHVRGERITHFCDQQKLSLRARLELFLQVCDAVNHAHQRGVIHRDLKPSNVLVSGEHDPQIKIIDFGIAKATERRIAGATLVTELSHFLGTPAYVSPEQADLLPGNSIDTRSDIYSLGALLYELLTGETPFEAQRLKKASYTEVQRILREEIPPRPSQRIKEGQSPPNDLAINRQTTTEGLYRTLHGELDWVVMKALEKDHERRYESAAAFGRDLNAHLANRPVAARPPDVRYRLSKWVRRHRVSAAMAAILTIAAIVSVHALFNSYRHARQAANEARKSTQALKLIDELFLASGAPVSAQVRPLLDSFVQDLDRKSDAQGSETITLLETVGRAYQRLGAFEEAGNHLERALTLSLQESGDSPTTARVRSSLGWLHRDAGAFAEARSALESAMHAQEEALGRQHPERLRSLAYLADVYRQIGDPSEAERLAVELKRQLHDGEKAGRLTASDVLSLQRAARSPHSASPIDQLALAKRSLALSKSQGLSGPALLPALYQWFDQAVMANELDEAEQALQEARAIVASQNDLEEDWRIEMRAANLAAARGHLRSAQQTLANVYAAQKERANLPPRDVMRTALALVELKLRRQIKRASGLADEVLEFHASEYGTNESLTLRSQMVVAGFHSLHGEHQKAVSLAKAVLANTQTQFGVSAPLSLEAERALVACFAKAGQLEDGKAIAMEARERHTQIFGSRHRHTLLCERLLGDLYSGAGHWAESERIYMRIIPVLAETLGADHADTMLTELRLGMVEEKRRFTFDQLERFEKLYASPDVAFSKLPVDDALAGYYSLTYWYRRHFQREKTLAMIDLGLQFAEEELGDENRHTPIYASSRDYIVKGWPEVKKRVPLKRAEYERLAKLGPEHADARDTAQIMVGSTLIYYGDHEQAETVAREVYQRVGTRTGPRSELFREAARMYAYSHWFQHEWTEGDVIMKHALGNLEGAPSMQALGDQVHHHLYEWAGKMKIARDRAQAFYEWNCQIEDRNKDMVWNHEEDLAKGISDKIHPQSRWRFMDDGRNLGSDWIRPDYDDSQWPEGIAPFGFNAWGLGTQAGEGDGQGEKPTTVYFRRKFFGEVGDPIIRMRRDDAAAVYINGVEVVRDGLPADATFDTFAQDPAEEKIEQYWYYTFRIPQEVLRLGWNTIAVEVHQDTMKDDLVFDLNLRVRKSI